MIDGSFPTQLDESFHPLEAVRKRLGLCTRDILDSWKKWAKKKKLEDRIKRAGERYIKGQTKVDMAEAALTQFFQQEHNVELEPACLRPITPELEDPVDHIRQFSKENAGCDLLRSVAGEYVLYRLGFDRGNLVPPISGKLMPYHLKISKAKRGIYSFKLRSIQKNEGPWFGTVIARDNWAYFIGFGKTYKQFLTMTLTLIDTERKMLAGVQLLQCAAPDHVETCYSRLVTCVWTKDFEKDVEEDDKGNAPRIRAAQDWIVQNMHYGNEKSEQHVRAFLFDLPRSEQTIREV